METAEVATSEVPEEDKPSSPLAQSPPAENSAGPSVPASREVKSRLETLNWTAVVWEMKNLVFFKCLCECLHAQALVCNSVFVSNNVMCCLPCLCAHAWMDSNGVISWLRQHSLPRCHSAKGYNQSSGLSLLLMLVMESRPAASPGILSTRPSHHLKMW